MSRSLAATSLVLALLAAPAAAIAGGAGHPNPGVVGIPGPGIVAPGSFGSPLVPVPNTAAARQWSPRYAPGTVPPRHHHHGQRAFVSGGVVVVPPAVVAQPAWVEPGWRWDGWQWVWVPGYWAW